MLQKSALYRYEPKTAFPAKSRFFYNLIAMSLLPFSHITGYSSLYNLYISSSMHSGFRVLAPPSASMKSTSRCSVLDNCLTPCSPCVFVGFISSCIKGIGIFSDPHTSRVSACVSAIIPLLRVAFFAFFTVNHLDVCAEASSLQLEFFNMIVTIRKVFIYNLLTNRMQS